MLDFITTYAVPAGLVVLMLIAGTDLRPADFRRAAQYPAVVVITTFAQLLLLPVLALLIAAAFGFSAALTASIVVLALCPGGAISNYYCYLANCNVALSATITAVSTLASLIGIPVWLSLLHQTGFPVVGDTTVPALKIFAQLMAFMALPLGLGMLARRHLRERLDPYGKTLRSLSLLVVALILGAATWTVRAELAVGAATILPAAALFTLAAMLLGWLIARSARSEDTPVVVVEFAVRNIGVAILIGSAHVPANYFAIFFSFLTGYFIVEMLIMVGYAAMVRSRVRPAADI